MTKVQNKTEAESKPANLVVLDIFSQKILNGEYRSGDRLKETLLAVEFGVSRNAIREALNQLVGYHVVEYVPYCGYRMKVFTHRDYLEWFEFREAIEPIAARRLAILRPEEAIAKLEEYIAQMQIAKDEGKLDEVSRLDMFFHLTLIEYCDNSIFNEILNKLYFTAVFSNYQKKAPASALETEEAFFQTHRIHRDILRYIKEGNADDVEVLTRKHARYQVGNIMDFIALRKADD